MRSRRANGIISPVSLREVYHELGIFTAKMMIDPSLSQTIDAVDVEVRNADGRPMSFSTKRWGTKLTVQFEVDAQTPDGVSIIDVSMRRHGQVTRERLDFWIIKP